MQSVVSDPRNPDWKPRRPNGHGYTGRTTPRWADDYGTMPVVLEVLRAAGAPMRVGDIIRVAGERLPTKAVDQPCRRYRRNVVARDLVRELARGDESRVRRVGPGLFEAVR